MQNRIFSDDSSKAIKAQGLNWLNPIHYMAPANMAGVGNLCSHASPACIAACLGKTSGQAGIVLDLDSDADQGNVVRKSRIEKARRFMRERAAYMRDVVRSIELAEAKAQRLGFALCVRLNGSTDIAWEGIAVMRGGKPFRNIFLAFPHLQFIDYTKNPRRFERQLPSNYHLTFSRSETNEADCIRLLARGFNVAVVFETKPMTWKGFEVVDGDAHDLRHLDPRAYGDMCGFVVALVPKGRKAKKDTSGFVVRS